MSPPDTTIHPFSRANYQVQSARWAQIPSMKRRWSLLQAAVGADGENTRILTRWHGGGSQARKGGQSRVASDERETPSFKARHRISEAARSYRWDQPRGSFFEVGDDRIAINWTAK
jgi:hypothetical protein